MTQLRAISDYYRALKEARQRQLQDAKWPARAIVASSHAKQGRHGWGGQLERGISGARPGLGDL